MDSRICFVGDSFTHGVGDADALGWRGRLIQRMLAKNPGITAYDLGVRHETSTDILHRWEGEARVRLAKGYAHRLMFCFGANDCADNGSGGPRVEMAESMRNAHQILSEATAMAPTLLLGVPPIHDDPVADKRVAALEARLAEAAGAHDVPFLSMFEYLREKAAWTETADAGDGTHPDGAGYALMTDRIWHWAAFQRWMRT